MKIKTSLRFYLILVRIAIIKNTVKGTLLHCLWECKLGQPLWKTIWRLLKNLNIVLPYDSAIPFLGMYSKECNTDCSKGTCMPMFIAVLFTIAKLWKQPRCPTTYEWIKKMYLYTILLSHKEQ
jgi:hypothetical protein